MRLPDTYSAVTPTPDQFDQLVVLRSGFRLVAEMLDKLPPGPRRDNAHRELEASSMWASKAVTHADVPSR